MFFITLIAFLLLYNIYFSLAKLLNPGFVSVYDKYLFRSPFYNDPYYVGDYLEKQNIRTGLFGKLTTEVQGISDTIEFTYSPFWVAVNRWLMVILLIAIIMLAINRVLIALKKLPEYIADIPVYAMVILSIGGYYLSVKVLGGYTPVNDRFHLGILLLVIFSVFVIVFGIIRKKSADKWNGSEEKKKSKKMMTFMTVVVIAQVLLFLIVPGKFMLDAIKVYKDYKPIYGSYNPEKKKIRRDLEENGFAGNFANQAVDTENGLYFIENKKSADDSYISYIRKLDVNGNITDICSSKADKEEYYNNYINIGYADGYIYASTSYLIYRIDPEDGSAVEAISAKNDYCIAEMCVVDNKLYYAEIPDDYTSGEKAYAWVCKIDGTGLTEPELYAGGLNRGVFNRFSQFESSALLTNIVIGDYVYNKNDGGRLQRCDKRTFYVMRGYTWNDVFTPTQLIIEEDSDPKNRISIEKVGGFTLYNNSIYYVQLKENGFDLCKCDTDGSNTEVLDTYICDKDLSKSYYQSVYNIMIGQGKIYVSAIGYIYPEDDYRSIYDLEWDEIHFMTELK